MSGARARTLPVYRVMPGLDPGIHADKPRSRLPRATSGRGAHCMNIEPDYASYKRCMEEIKRRLRAIDDILSNNKTTSFKYTNNEFVALQFRRVFELIILATLASHHHLFEGLVRKLSREWQIAKVIALVRKRNPAFYPIPIDRVPASAPEIKDEWKDIASGFLTLDELISAHGRIAMLMHASNPYREAPSVNEFEKQFPVWRERSVRLLNNHLIKFPGNKTILYVGMQSPTGEVHTALFGLKT